MANMVPVLITHKVKKDRRTLLIKIFSPLLFAAPNALLESLTNHWVDQITIKARWVKFFTKMNEQWGQHIVQVSLLYFILYGAFLKVKQSSILLNANVAFLAIPSNDPSNNSVLPQPHRTVAQIASYVSILTSFGSMILALLLVRKHKAKEDAMPLINDYHNFLKHHHHPIYGFEAIAIMYSLPYALLIWSMGSFFVAVVLMCFVVSTTVVRSIVGVASGLVFAVIVWCIQTFWDESGFQVRQHLKEILPLLHKVFRIRGLEVITPDESDTTAVEMDSAPAMQQEAQSTHEHDSAAKQHMCRSWLMSVIEWRRGDRSLSRV
ncbi:hypothetical protein H0H93_006416 [Arthromyces matolae]|nr:hypothetical protein H0H93_006416 [Arthromyces matolae]